MNIPTAPLEPPRRILWPADSDDVDERRRYIEELLRHAAAQVVALLDDLNQHLPVTRTIDAADFVRGLDDLIGDTLAGPMLHIAERLDEDDAEYREPPTYYSTYGNEP